MVIPKGESPTRITIKHTSKNSDLNHITIRFKISQNSAPPVGFEPTTNRLTVVCSTIELQGNVGPAGTPAELPKDSIKKSVKMQR